MQQIDETDQSAKSPARGLSSLNKVLIGIGAIAFGLIITDRVMDMFRADELPVAVDAQSDMNTVDSALAPAVSGEILQNSESPPQDEIAAGVDEIDIEDVFGSRLVFVSASEPLYVVTEDERRIDVGSPIDDETTLAGVTVGRVILERTGNLMVVSLPEIGE